MEELLLSICRQFNICALWLVFGRSCSYLEDSKLLCGGHVVSFDFVDIFV